MSRRLIKNNQVDMIMDCLEIPLTPISLANSREKEPEAQGEMEEEVSQTKAELEEIIRQAHAQAQDIIHKARQQSEAIKDNAREEGYQAGVQEGKRSGYQAGYDEATQKTKEMKNKAKALLQNAHQESRSYISRTREEIIQLAATMARKIIHINIDLNDEGIVEMVKDALHRSEEKKQILLRCPAEFISVLQAHCSQFEKMCPNAAFVILEDPAVKSPGCVIETEDQVIDLEVDQQLNNIVNALQTMEK